MAACRIVMSRGSDDPASPQARLGRALASFADALPRALAAAPSCSLADVKAEVLRIQEEQDRARTMMDLTRAEAFIEGVEQLGEVLRGFVPEGELNTLLGYVWGPMRYLLRTASTTEDPFEKLLAAYLDFGLALPELVDYGFLFRESAEMRATLVDLYSEILRFHQIVLGFFSGISWGKLFKAAWKDFNPVFRNGILANVKLLQGLVASQGDLLRPLISAADLPSHGSRPAPTPAAPLSLDRQIMAIVREVDAYEARRLHQTRALEEDEARRHIAETEAVLAWVAPPAGAAEQNAETHRRLCRAREKVPGGGRWILKDDRVDNWLCTTGVPTHSVLWLTGRRGAGKSVLASAVAEECRRRCPHTAYVYCSSASPSRSSHMAILQALLHQLLSSYRALLPSYHARMISAGHHTLSSEDHGRALLDLIVEFIPRAFLIVDGLDECAPGQARLAAAFLADLVRRCDGHAPGKVRLLVVSGGGIGGEVRRCLAGASIVALRGEEESEDLRRVVARGVARLRPGTMATEMERERLAAMVCRAASGSFLYAKLAVKHLSLTTTPTAAAAQHHGPPPPHRLLAFSAPQLPHSPQSPPSSLQDLHHAVLHSVKRGLDGQSPALWPRALDLLAWVFCARRPLEWHELRAITGFAYSSSSSSPSPVLAANFGQYVRDLCGPLVRVVDGDRVEPAFDGSREMILSCADLIDESAMYLRLAVLCLRYLCLDCFRRERVPDAHRRTYAAEGHFAFGDYATVNWSGHLRAVLGSCAGLFARRPELAAELDAVLDEFMSSYGPGLRHEPHPEFSIRSGGIAAAVAAEGADEGGSGEGPQHYAHRLHHAHDHLPHHHHSYGHSLGHMHNHNYLHGHHPDGYAAAGAAVRAYAFFPKAEFLLSHMFSHSKRPGAQDRLSVPQLQASVRENRKALEQLLLEQAGHPTSALASGPLALRTSYGPRPYKCAHPTCPRFHVGFGSAHDRAVHHDRHDRPFPCPETGCPHGPFGFQTAKDRDRHVRQYHPHESAQLPPFVQPSRRRRWDAAPEQQLLILQSTAAAAAAASSTSAPASACSSAAAAATAVATAAAASEGAAATSSSTSSAAVTSSTDLDSSELPGLAGLSVASHSGASVITVGGGIRLFMCDMCNRSFTRKINLIGHVRSHYGERPFACGACGKAFARSNDCKRHERIHTRRGRNY